MTRIGSLVPYSEQTSSGLKADLRPPVDTVMLADTITKLGAAHRGQVVVSGSHGGIYAGCCAAKGGVRAVVLNDAGIGRDQAGIGSLAYLDGIGIAAATADSLSCRIADAADMMAHGVVSHVNKAAADLGCAPGQSVEECAGRLQTAIIGTMPVPPIKEARFVLSDAPGSPAVIGIDSASLFQADDAGRIVVTASHGGLVGGKADTTVPAGVLAAIFNDAGGCKDGSGFSRLADLDKRGVAAATVAASSARIGDARSSYADGVLSHVNATAERLNGRVGMSLKAFIDGLVQAMEQRP